MAPPKTITGPTMTIVALGLALGTITVARSQNAAQDPGDRLRQQRFTVQGAVDPETGNQPAALIAGRMAAAIQAAATEALTGFDNITNGFDDQGPPFDTLDEDNVVALRSFNDNRFIFEEAETIAEGLGPTYNAQSCRECHQNVVTGGASQIAEHRTGHMTNGVFFESQGGSLVHSRATNPEIVERVAVQDDIRTFRISTNTLGNGLVEAIANSTLQDIRDRQPQALRGSLVTVPVLEANSFGRFGRFGWKNQHASLQSFAADAYLNEMGITTPTFPFENTSSGRSVAAFDPAPDPEDDGEDVVAFANFMRSTKAPSRGPINSIVRTGEGIFTLIGCAVCHVSSITTAPVGTRINGGAMTVPAALGDKIIHPFSDFLLHDIDTGDGIPIQPTPEFAFTANKIRTAPLWALRTRNRLMHDGLSFTLEDAIARHGGQASGVRQLFNALPAAQKAAVIAFLNSL
jgi:CxxC motif-containing protein (DUF1111 family)